MYSGIEVCDAMRSVLVEYQENAHGIILPAAVMLVGGILLDVSGRRSASRVLSKKGSDGSSKGVKG
jgi:hypothetical protein